MSMTNEEALKLICDRVKEIDNTRVYFCLKSMKIKPLTIKIVENMKICIAITEMKLPISLQLFNYVKGRKDNPIMSMTALHTLGDKKLLNFIRGYDKDYHACRWLLGELFSNLYYGDKK